MTDIDTDLRRLGGEADQRVHFITPFIAAFPNPIVLPPTSPITGTTPAGKSVLHWTLLAAPSADLYAYPPGGGEKFLGTKRRDGWVESGPIRVGQTYRWKIFPEGDKTTLYDEEAVTARELELPLGAGPLGHPQKNENVFFPTNWVSRAQWYLREYHSFWSGPSGLFTEGLVEFDRAPTPAEVLVGYMHRHETAGWLGADYEQYDVFWRGGVQFDATAIQAYVQRWGMAAATLRFRVSQGNSTSLSRIEQAAQDMTDWEAVADGIIPGDDPVGVDLPTGLLPLGTTSDYEIRADGVISVNVGVIAYRWSSFSFLPHAFVLIGPDERWVQDDTSTFLTHYSDFVLEITPSPFR